MLIYGWKSYARVLAVLRLVCGQCGNASEHVLRKITTKFTLFFIPLFPINKKHTLFCTACEHEQKLQGAQAQELMATGGAPMGMPSHAPAQRMPAPPPPGMPVAGPAGQFGPGPYGPRPPQGPPPGYPPQPPPGGPRQPYPPHYNGQR